MNRTSNNRSGLFLLEIMIAILFFAMVSAVCLRSFARAHTLSQEASDMNQAMSHIENVAELLKSADSAVLDDSEQTVNLLNTEYALYRWIKNSTRSTSTMTGRTVPNKKLPIHF